jgi:hypothetical protein
MDCLKQLKETDGTFGHELIVEQLRLTTADGQKPLFSLDLSNATDRFPVSLQEDLLAAAIGPGPAKSWRKLMTERDFVVTGDHKVRYSCGQPMGLLSS